MLPTFCAISAGEMVDTATGVSRAIAMSTTLAMMDAQAKGRGFKADASHVRFGSEGSGFVADEGDDDVAVSCSVQAKRAVGSGGDTAAAAFDHYSCSRKCTACGGVGDFTCDLRKRNRCRRAENAHEGEVNKMFHAQIVNLMI